MKHKGMDVSFGIGVGEKEQEYALNLIANAKKMYPNIAVETVRYERSTKKPQSDAIPEFLLMYPYVCSHAYYSGYTKKIEVKGGPCMDDAIAALGHELAHGVLYVERTKAKGTRYHTKEMFSVAFELYETVG